MRTCSKVAQNEEWASVQYRTSKPSPTVAGESSCSSPSVFTGEEARGSGVRGGRLIGADGGGGVGAAGEGDGGGVGRWRGGAGFPGEGVLS